MKNNKFHCIASTADFMNVRLTHCQQSCHFRRLSVMRGFKMKLGDQDTDVQRNENPVDYVRWKECTKNYQTYATIAFISEIPIVFPMQ